MQYMIADETVVPHESRRFYTEKMLYMPHSYFVNDHKQVLYAFALYCFGILVPCCVAFYCGVCCIVLYCIAACVVMW